MGGQGCGMEGGGSHCSTSGTPEEGREVGRLGWAADGIPDTGWANLARTSRMRRWTSWAADVADGALTTGRANLARTSEMRRSTSILMRRASASGVLEDTLTVGRVRGGAEVNRAIRSLKRGKGLLDEARGSETGQGASKRSEGLRNGARGFEMKLGAPRQG